MGPHDSSTDLQNVQLFTEDGTLVAGFTPDGDITEVYCLPNGGKDMIAGMWGPITFSVTVSIPKAWRCGSRKRFIKLLMSYGYSRNNAAKIAAAIRTQTGPDTYQQLFFMAIAPLAERQL